MSADLSAISSTVTIVVAVVAIITVATLSIALMLFTVVTGTYGRYDIRHSNKEEDKNQSYDHSQNIPPSDPCLGSITIVYTESQCEKLSLVSICAKSDSFLTSSELVVVSMIVTYPPSTAEFSTPAHRCVAIALNSGLVLAVSKLARLRFITVPV